MRSKHIFILCLYLFSLPAGLLAQATPHFLENLTTMEGLSSNKINDLLQDDDGFLWIATTDGLNRFDGTETLSFYHSSKPNSLPHNYVFCLEKLAGNYIAVGTQGGLSFYNTRTKVFENFYFNGEKTLEEYNNIIIDLEKDSYGNLWAIARNCIFVFSPGRKLLKTIFSVFTEADASRQRLKFIEKTIPLSNGNMLIYRFDGWHLYSAAAPKGTALEDLPPGKDGGLFGEMKRLGIIEKNNLFFPPANIFKVFGRYLLCIRPGIDSLLLIDENGKHQGSIHFPYNRFPFLSWSQQAAVIDSSTILFLFHSYGLAGVDVRWQNNEPRLTGCSGLLFEDLEFSAALRDRQRNWWLGTAQSGLRKLSPHKQRFQKTLLQNRAGEKNKSETVSISSYKNSLWIATYGDGFYRKDLKTGKTEHYLLPADPADPWPNFVWNVRQFHPDSAWLGTQVGLFWYCISNRSYGRVDQYPGKPSALDSNAITTQFMDSHGFVWMGIGRGNGVCRFDTKQRRFEYFKGSSAAHYPLRYPTHIVEDGKTNLWFVSDGSSELVYWKRDKKRFEMVELPFDAGGVSDLTAIWRENDSVLWIGTLADGLLRFDLASRATKTYGHETGIGDSHVNGIFQDRSKRIWAGTFGNLSSLNPATGLFTNYTPKDGLPVDFPTCVYYDAKQGRLYGAGHGVLFSFDPDGMDPPQEPQKTMITAMEVNGQPFLFMEEEGRFRPSQNDITIYYSAIDLTNGPDTKYAYKLIGDDTAWVPVGSQRQINFSNLAPGNYSFMVRASNNTGAWSGEAAVVKFSISKQFTQTAWFYGLIIAAMGGVFYALYRFRVRQLLRTEEVRSEISKNLHDEVGSALTNISLGTLLAQKQLQNKASVKSILERIYQDSQNVSESMRDIIWSINPKIDTVDEALPRMLHYASELLEAKNIEVRAVIAPDMGHMKLSMQQRRDLYMIFKETINNLAKHSGATQVEIKWGLEHGVLTMFVSDNGVGFAAPASSGHNGLKNMRERAGRHGWNLDIRSLPGSGTTVVLKARIA